MGRERQVVWLSAEATSFAAPCEACLADVDSRSVFARYRAARFEGTLQRAADVGFMTCPRGHRILVRRALGPLGELRARA